MDIKVLSKEEAEWLQNFDIEHGDDDCWTMIPADKIPFDDPYYEPEDIVAAYLELAMDSKMMTQTPDEMDVDNGIYGFLVHRYVVNDEMKSSGVIPIKLENSLMKDSPVLLLFPWAIKAMETCYNDYPEFAHRLNVLSTPKNL